jgi:hypothetical protein
VVLGYGHVFGSWLRDVYGYYLPGIWPKENYNTDFDRLWVVVRSLVLWNVSVTICSYAENELRGLEDAWPTARIRKGFADW